MTHSACTAVLAEACALLSAELSASFGPREELPTAQPLLGHRSHVLQLGEQGSAVDINTGASDKRGLIGRQVDRQVGDFLWLALSF